MIKPDGFARICTEEEIRTAWEVWADVLAWLRGADHDDLAHKAEVDKVAQKAGLRSVRFAEYDIRLWSAQAAAVPIAETSVAGAQPLGELAAAMLLGLGFAEEEPRFRGWLNRVAIEVLYGDAPVFHLGGGRAVIVPALLSGPVEIASWRGGPRELALAVKFVLRFVMAPRQTVLPVTPACRSRNLIHMESVTDSEFETLGAALDGPIPCTTSATVRPPSDQILPEP
jgi:hypothetical protein